VLVVVLVLGTRGFEEEDDDEYEEAASPLPTFDRTSARADSHSGTDKRGRTA
jgi:hypothetical protein